MPDVFLSYSRDDQAAARRFAEGFERAGLKVWWDATLSSGEAYDQVTEKALKSASAVVVLWSKKSVESRWVRAEATIGDRNKTLVPVMIEACERPIMFELTHTADLSQWKGDVSDKAWQSYVADVRKFVDRNAPQATTAQVQIPPRSHSRSKRIGLTVIAALALLFVAGGVQWALTHRGAAPTDQTAMAGTTLAVLPFVNLSPDRDQEYFSDGLTEEILNQLAQIKDLRLTARTSSFAFKGKNEDVRVIGQQLGVANLLEGSIRKDGNQLRITAQLVKSSDGTHQWSQTYDRELNGVFALQEDIAKDVAHALSIRLDVGEVTRAEGGTNNVEAYDKYLQANALNRGGLSSPAQRKAAQLYRDALMLDPNFARASYDLYGTLGLLAVFPDDAAAATREMTGIAARLEAQSPTAVWTQLIRSNRLANEHRWSDAQAAINAVQASSGVALGGYGSILSFLSQVGRVAEAARAAEEERRSDPLSLNVSTTLQRQLDGAGRDADAQAEYERSKSLDGDHGEANHHALFRLWRMPGTTPAQIKAQFDLILAHESLPMELTHILARDPGNVSAARAAIRQAFDAPGNQDQIRMFVIALYAAHYGDKDLALAAMKRRFIDMKSVGFFQLWYPYEGNLRADPRFKQLLRDLGLAGYFRSSGNWPDYCKPVGKDDFQCQ